MNRKQSSESSITHIKSVHTARDKSNQQFSVNSEVICVVSACRIVVYM